MSRFYSNVYIYKTHHHPTNHHNPTTQATHHTKHHITDHASNTSPHQTTHIRAAERVRQALAHRAHDFSCRGAAVAACMSLT